MNESRFLLPQGLMLILCADWFEYPRVRMVKGSWTVEMPSALAGHVANESFSSLDEVFDIRSRPSANYERWIKETLEQLRNAGHKFGALLLEPVIIGAGGMSFVFVMILQGWRTFG